jgi:hypothetical protein
MSKFRKMAEEAKASKAAGEAAAQAEAERSEQDEQEQGRRQFLETVRQRGILQGALGSLNTAKADFARARAAQRTGRQTLEAERQEAIGAGAENVPTVYELLQTPEDELDADSSEADYKEKKEAVRTTGKSVQVNRSELLSLGVDVSDESEEALVAAAEERKKSLDREAKEYVYTNPDSELPEVQEVKREIIEDLTRDILKSPGWIRGFQNTLSSGMREADISEERLSRADEYAQGQIRKRLTHTILQSTARAEGFEGFIKKAQAVSGDQFAIPAIAEALKQTLLNYARKSDGSVVHEDSTFYYYMDNYQYRDSRSNQTKKAPDSLARIYNATMGGAEMPDEAYYIEDDGQKDGLKPEAGPILAQVFDPAQLENFSGKVVQLANVEKDLEALPAKQLELERKVREVENKRNELRNLYQDISGLNAALMQNREQLKKQQISVANLDVALSGEEMLLTSRISIREAHGRIAVEIQGFKDDLNKADAKVRERREELVGSANEAKRAYDTARSEYTAEEKKLVSFKKGGLKTAMDVAKVAWDSAQGKVDNSTQDGDFAQLSRAAEEIRSDYRRVSDSLKRALEQVEISYDGVTAMGMDGLKQSFQADTAREEQAIATQESDIQTKQGSYRELEGEIAAINQELRKATGYESPDVRTVSDVMRQKGDNLRRDVEGLKKQLKGE